MEAYRIRLLTEDEGLHSEHVLDVDSDDAAIGLAIPLFIIPSLSWRTEHMFESNTSCSCYARRRNLPDGTAPTCSDLCVLGRSLERDKRQCRHARRRLQLTRS